MSIKSTLHFFKSHPLVSAVVVFQFIRLLLVPLTGLMPQDAYYFFYGQHLDWSYFDHPGMIAFLLRGFSEILGHQVWVIKLTDFTISSLTLIGFYHLGKRFLPPHRNQVSIFVLGSSLLLSMLSLNSTPDVPLLLFWVFSLLYTHKSLESNSVTNWLLSGLFMGLAFNSKYTALLLPFGMIAYLIFSKENRKKLSQVGPWLAIVVFLILSYPVYLWNELHQFVSFGFQTAERSSSMGFSKDTPRLFFGFLFSQMLLVYPVVFIGLSLLAYKSIRRVLFKRKLFTENTLFLLAFFIPTFVGFFLLSPLYWIKINWLVPSYISGIILLAAFYKKRHLRLQKYVSYTLILIIAIEVSAYIIPIKSDDTFWGWEELAEKVALESNNYPNDFIFSADGYKTSAVLQFYLKDKPIYSANIIGEQGLQFSIVRPVNDTLIGSDALFIDSDPRLKETITPIPNKLSRVFDSIQPLKPIEIKNNKDKTLRKFYLYKCFNYKGI